MTQVTHIVNYTDLLLEEIDEHGMTSAERNMTRVRDLADQLQTSINESLPPYPRESLAGSLGSLRDRVTQPLTEIEQLCKQLCRSAPTSSECSAQADLTQIIGAVRVFRRIIRGALLEWSSDADRATIRKSRTQRPALDRASAPTARALPTAASAQLGQFSVLVVDDDRSNRDTLSRRLQRQGFSVTLAESGRAAFDRLERFQSEPYDIVLLDIIMPGINGYDVLKRMKETDGLRDIPVIMISALDDIQNVAQCIEMGAEDCLTKPFAPMLLRARLGACLEKKRLRDQEVLYLQQVALIATAAADVEANQFQPGCLDDIAQRPDQLGLLARVFQRMGREVIARETRLRREVEELRVEVDETRKARDVAAITNSDHFQLLQERIRILKARK